MPTRVAELWRFTRGELGDEACLTLRIHAAQTESWLLLYSACTKDVQLGCMRLIWPPAPFAHHLHHWSLLPIPVTSSAYKSLGIVTQCPTIFFPRTTDTRYQRESLRAGERLRNERKSKKKGRGRNDPTPEHDSVQWRTCCNLAFPFCEYYIHGVPHATARINQLFPDAPDAHSLRLRARRAGILVNFIQLIAPVLARGPLAFPNHVCLPTIVWTNNVMALRNLDISGKVQNNIGSRQ